MWKVHVHLLTRLCGKSQLWLQSLSSPGITVCAITSLFATWQTSSLCEGNFNIDYTVDGNQRLATSFTDGQGVLWCSGVCNAKYLCHCGKDALRVKDVGGPSTRWHLWLGQSRLLMDLDSMQNLWPWTPIQYPDCNNMNQVLGTTVQEIRDEDILDQSRSTISSPQLITGVLPAHSS